VALLRTPYSNKVVDRVSDGREDPYQTKNQAFQIKKREQKHCNHRLKNGARIHSALQIGQETEA
jgi:hypothetical protein